MYVLAYKIEQDLSQELSAEIGDYFRNVTLEKSKKNEILIAYWSFLLAKHIRFAQKESDLFLRGFFEDEWRFLNNLTIWNKKDLKEAFRISAIMLN